MVFYDSANNDIKVSFEKAVIDVVNRNTGGIFMPSEIQKIPRTVIYRNPPPSFRDVVLEIAKGFCSDEIPEADLMNIVAEFYPYRIPVTPISQSSYLVELFHGPTCNYKDIGSAFLAHLIDYFSKINKKRYTVFAAGSSERTCALGQAFSKVKNTDAVILYPKHSLNQLNKNIIAASEKNVHYICVDGSLTDCEKILNEFFADREFKSRLNIVNGSSLNFALIIPQIAFLIYSALQVFHRCGYDNKIEHPDIGFSIPSGSFSALTSAVIAKKMQIPVSGFVAAENQNHRISDWLNSKETVFVKPVKTNTPALDFANEFNFTRMLEVYSFEELQNLIIPYVLNDEECISAVRNCNYKTGYIIDPYGGMAWQAWNSCCKNIGLTSEFTSWIQQCEKENLIGIILQTSHPGKFIDVMNKAVIRPPSLPDKLESLPDINELDLTEIPPDYSALKEYLFYKVR